MSEISSPLTTERTQKTSTTNVTHRSIRRKNLKRPTVDDTDWLPYSPVKLNIDEGYKVF